MTPSFHDLPDHSRLYVFAASRPLAPGEASTLLEAVDLFLEKWKAHKDRVVAARDWVYDRFLLIGVDESETRLSGCSIDGMIHRLKELEVRLGVELVDSAPVLFRADGEIRRLDRNAFRDRVREGRVHPGTVVFNNTLPTVADLRQGKWEVPFRDSWHFKAFARADSARTGVE